MNLRRVNMNELMRNVADNPVLLAAIADYSKAMFPDMDVIEIYVEDKMVARIEVAGKKNGSE